MRLPRDSQERPRGPASSPSVAKLPFRLHELAAIVYQKQKPCASAQPKDSYCSHSSKLNFGSPYKSSSGPTFRFIFSEGTSPVSILHKNRWKGVKMEPGSSQWCQDKRQRAQTEIYEIPPKHKKTLFAVKVDEQGNRLSGEVVESPSLEKFKQSGHSPGQPPPAGPASSWRVGLDTFRATWRDLQPQLFCDLVTSSENITVSFLKGVANTFP